MAVTSGTVSQANLKSLMGEDGWSIDGSWETITLSNQETWAVPLASSCTDLLKYAVKASSTPGIQVDLYMPPVGWKAAMISRVGETGELWMSPEGKIWSTVKAGCKIGVSISANAGSSPALTSFLLLGIGATALWLAISRDAS